MRVPLDDFLPQLPLAACFLLFGLASVNLVFLPLGAIDSLSPQDWLSDLLRFNTGSISGSTKLSSGFVSMRWGLSERALDKSGAVEPTSILSESALIGFE